VAILTYAEVIVLDPSLATYPEEYIQALLDASEEWIVAYLGAGDPTYEEPTAVSELITVRGELFFLSRPASEIISVKERGVTLDADDYELRFGGTVVRRLGTGTYPYAYGWYGGIDITYVPLSDVASRRLAQLELIKLELNTNPGALSETIGAWSETISTTSKDQYLGSREAILAALRPGFVGIH
jgi:hypothetical protein